MLRTITYALVASFFITGCSENEVTFLENLSIEIPLIETLEISNAGIQDVILKDESRIEGFTNSFYFTSSNLPTNFSKINGGINLSEIIYRSTSEITLFDYDGGTFELSITDRTLSSSPSYTTRFTMFPREEVKIDQYFYFGNIDYRDAHFVSNNQGWIIGDYERGSNGPHQDQFPHGIRVYSVTGNTYNHIATIEGFRFVSNDVKFTDASQGYIIAYKNNEDSGFLFYTYDGGYSWQELYSFPHDPDQIIIKNDHIIIQHNNGYIISSDKKNWQSVDLPNVVSTSITSDGTLFSSVRSGSDSFGTICNLYVSEDNGINWSLVAGKQFYGHNIYFLNDLNGISYSYSILQRTNDGGKNWELLSFPIDLEEE